MDKAMDRPWSYCLRWVRSTGVDRTVPNRGCKRVEDPKGLLSRQHAVARVGGEHRNRPPEGLDLVGLVEIRVT